MKICSQCGSKMKSDDAYCAYCGMEYTHKPIRMPWLWIAGLVIVVMAASWFMLLRAGIPTKGIYEYCIGFGEWLMVKTGLYHWYLLFMFLLPGA